MKIGPSWPEDGMRKWEVIVSRTLRKTGAVSLFVDSPPAGPEVGQTILKWRRQFLDGVAAADDGSQ